MNINELNHRLTRIQDALNATRRFVQQQGIVPDPAGTSRKTRSDRQYLTKAEKQRAYRQRKKGTPNTA